MNTIKSNIQTWALLIRKGIVSKCFSKRMASMMVFLLVIFSGNLSTAKSVVDPIWKRIEITNASRVTIVQGENCMIWIDGKEFPISSKDSVPNGEKVLEIDSEWIRVRKFSVKEIKIQQPQLSEIQIKGVVSLQSEGILRCNLLRIGISGVGNINLNLDAEEILADVNGIGRLVLKGQSAKVRFDINGPGIIDAKALITRQAKVFIDGLGLCKLDVTDSLYADISGGGSIRYRKEPPYLVNRISGLGSMAAWETDDSSNEMNDSKTSIDSLAPSLGSPSDFKSNDLNSSDSKRNAGDFWAGRRMHEPRMPFLELGLAHWVDRGGGSLQSQWNSSPEPYGILAAESDKSWFLNWSTPLQVQGCLYRSTKENSKDSLKGVSIWARGALVLSYQSFRFEDNLVLGKDRNSAGEWGLHVSRVDTPGSPRFDRSRLENLQIQIPLMIHLHRAVRPHKGWHVGGGIVPGIRLWSRSLNRYRDDGGRVEMYRTGNFYLNPFSLALRSEIGRGRFRMFTQYSVNSMFRAGYGPRINRVDLGVTLLSY
ncbi:MAG: DUF2807 domain-containing protein [Sphingomonadales bacterium]|nr:DUF2807 domain-containing protein [Sphingomonadales bacterium]